MFPIHFISGRIKGAFVHLQNLFNKPLWVPCRYHMGEVVLTHVWNSLSIDTTAGPEILFFKNRKKHFSSLFNIDSDDVTFNEALTSDTFLAFERQRTLLFLKQINTAGFGGD